ncbi:MAG: zinc ribbon domain-containing protein [Candidatus Heimdallarchaeota archaeon]
MGILGVSGGWRRLGKLGKVGLILLLLGIVGGTVLESITHPYIYTRRPRFSGRVVIRSANLIGRPINGVQMRVVAEPDPNDVPYSIGIVPADLTVNVREENDLEEYAVSFWVGSGPVELTYSQMMGSRAFDIVIFSFDTLTLLLTVSYDIAVGPIAGPITLIGAVFIILGLVLNYWSKRRMKLPFGEEYFPEIFGEPERRGVPRTADTETEGEYVIEQIATRSMPQEAKTIEPNVPEQVERIICTYCGATVSKSDVFCPNCYSELL